MKHLGIPFDDDEYLAFQQAVGKGNVCEVIREYVRSYSNPSSVGEAVLKKRFEITSKEYLKVKVRYEKENFNNLKSQCYFRLADKVNLGEIAVRCDTGIQELLTEELEVVKQKDVDKDNKIAIIAKDKVKELIGRSPDYSDALMMRMYFDISKSRIVASG